MTAAAILKPTDQLIPIRLDSEFHHYIPPLSEEERQQLELNILADGCRDPLILWGDILVDGYNRFEICTRLGIPFETVQLGFRDRESALDWMDAHQLGRRNLTPDARKLLLGRRYNRLKRSSEANLAQNSPKYQNDPSEKSTAERLAAKYGVSKATVKRAGKFAAEVDQDEELKAAVVAGHSAASVMRTRAEAAPPPNTPADDAEAKERRAIGRLSPDGMADEILGLRADLADAKTKLSSLKAERDDLRARLVEATTDNQGAVIAKLQKQLQAAKYARDEALAATKRMEYRLKKAEARTKELEDLPVEMRPS